MAWLRRLPSYSLFWGVLAAGLAGLAFFANPLWLRLTGAGAAILCAAVSTYRRVAAAPPPAAEPWHRRLDRFGGLVVASLLSLVGVLIGAAVILGWRLTGRTLPIAIEWMYVGLAVLFVVVILLVTWWFRAFGRIVVGATWRRRWGVLLGVVAAGAGLAYLGGRERPEELDRNGREQARQAGAGTYDLLLVIDPADDVSRSLILAAREERAAGGRGRLFPKPPGTVDYGIAYGLAVPERPSGGRPLWRLVEPPTVDLVEVTDSLASIPLGGARASGSYGRLLADVRVDDNVRWRRNAQRGVAFVLEDLPSLRELDEQVTGPGPSDAIAPWTEPEDACPKFIAGRPAPQVDEDPSVPVAWGDALALHCERLVDFRRWEDAGRLRGDAPPAPVAVHALTGEVRPDRDAPWWTWIRALDGRFHRPPLVVHDGQTSAEPESLLRDARDVHLGVPVGDLVDLAEWFRPHLYFDRDEQFFPADVDWMLGHAEPTGEHRVCDRELFADNCEVVTGHGGLTIALDEYLDFAGGVRFGADLAGRGQEGPTRMYVHVKQEVKEVRKDGARAKEHWLHLGYWWYFTYNVSPWRKDVNCLPGLTFKAVTCHDHEGDWEGVTVALRYFNPRVLPEPDQLGNLEPMEVIYEAHGHPVRWLWDEVELAADEGNHATHPVVYVAAGSHASYPVRCRADECDQRLANEPVPEGGFDGGVPWKLNDREECEADQIGPGKEVLGPCLIALPSTRDGGHGMLWNAFTGRWGRANCTVVAKVCSQVDGPRSPSIQGRFKHPSAAREGDGGLLQRRRQREGQRTDRAVKRWPPKPWPVPEGEPEPATPDLDPPGA